MLATRALNERVIKKRERGWRKRKGYDVRAAILNEHQEAACSEFRKRTWISLTL